MKLLLITPVFFGYERAIAKSIEKHGYSVDWFPHIHSNKKIYKFLYRYAKFLLLAKYYKYAIKKFDCSADYQKIVVIKGEGVGSRLLEKFRELFPNAELIFYNWDSMANNRIPLKILGKYDKLKSFDLKDCDKYIFLEHLPLFYTSIFEFKKEYKPKYDFCFVGTLHSVRERLFSKVINNIDMNTSNFIYFYYPSRLLFCLKCFLKPKYLSMFRDVNFKPLNQLDIRKIIENSKCVIDLSHSHQSGLTMRAIETLGMQKKLVTNNKMIKEYDFYNKDNIYVIGDDIGLKEFMLKPYVKINQKILNQYALDSWTLKLIN